ncbi:MULTISPECIES: hypothetical protein [Nostoc]|uniref:HEAT repeat domain-containing protein n=1 Tax=Nostoc paludosum FACHB-159 TaxID=2692908 RepID=A0ABR8KH91_9NOSO|nr:MULTISPECIES: hypothetical protein [Nostoc]MBD2681003.1 hypothetical protein [Nostoc sp. FACHB-857]MBD2737452.1 hypothetical protein [Nostoc paludosum FACHB-159]
MQSLNNPEKLLFTDREGNQGQLQDIIDDGLDGGYEDRIPGLINLLSSGEPYHQLLATVMLTSWGHPAGFKKLIDWANNSQNVPWKAAPVVYERISQTDSAFEMLADAVNTSYYADETQKIQQWQIDAIKALLGIYHQYYFGRSLALAIVRDKEIAQAVKNKIIAAIEASLTILQEHTSLGFDLAFQVACLLIPLIRIDEDIAVNYANQLIANYSHKERILREIANALGDGKGEATLAILQHLKTFKMPALVRDTESAIARRSRN